MNKKDKTAIQELAKEGKQLSKIMENDFPESIGKYMKQFTMVVAKVR